MTPPLSPAFANGQRYVSQHGPERERFSDPDASWGHRKHPRVYAECEERGCDPVIPMRVTKGRQIALPVASGGRLFPRIPRHSDRFRALYRRRASVERAFGDLKRGYGLAPLRVRGLERVALHADLVILARLGQTLSRARAVPLAA